MKKWTTTQWIAVSFLAAILAGTILLMMPFCTAAGETTSFTDALFTATSSVCVTGLVTVSTLSHWTAAGQAVILFLIQVGGLGLITVTFMVLILLRRSFSLREEAMVQDVYGQENLSGMRKMVSRIVLGTLAVEAAGAVCYSLVYVPEFGFFSGVGKAVFNSVSAFCNAGMDIVSEDSLAPYVTNPLINVTTICLIVVSGIGFPVWWDLQRVWKEKRKGQTRNYNMWQRLQLHSKLAISVTLILIAGGTVLFLAFEWNNPDTLGGLSAGEKGMAALFQSVTTRTAGFYTISQEALTNASVMLTQLLMLIGGSPMGTAGGMKTTTVAILVLTMISVLRGSRSTEVFGRRLSSESLRTALGVVLAALGVLFTASLILFVTDGFTFEDTLYEVVSAVGTVGLSRGITSALSVPGRLVIIAVMYLGRTGPITVAFLFFTGRHRNINVDLPESRVMIG